MLTCAEDGVVKLFFSSGQNYDCVQCARSCNQGWRIHVDPHTEERIESSPVTLRIVQEKGQERPVEIDPKDGSKILARQADGSCVFLNEQKLCSIHAEMGYEAKPVGCRQFPFQFTLTPDGVYVGISFWCTAAQQNVGRPMEVHEEDLRQLLALFRPPGWEGNLRLCLVSEAVIDWPTYQQVEELIGRYGTAAAVLALAELAGFAPPGEIPGGAFEVAFSRARPERLANDELLEESSRFFLTSMIGSIECTPDLARALTEDLMLDRPFMLPRGLQGTYSKLMATKMPPEFGPQVERYRNSLLHRKYLTRTRPLLENVVALHLVEPLMRFYTALFSRGDEARLEHVYQAFDTLELELYTHTTSAGLDSLLAAFAQAYVEVLQAG